MPARARSQRRADLGQHFLRDGALARKLVEASSIGPADRVLEIGPGRGALTRWLIKRCDRLEAIELDGSLCRLLRARFDSSDGVRVVEADFLAATLPSGRYKVFANPPFAYTSAILRRLTRAPTPPADIHLIVQLEAALDLAGMPWSGESLAALCLKPWWQIEVQERISKYAFDPAPRVDCALLWLARRDRPLVVAQQAALYRDFVSAAFGTRGTTVRDGLRRLFSHDQLRRLARELRVYLRARPSGVSFELWLALFRFFARTNEPGARRQVDGARRRRDGRAAAQRSRRSRR